MVNWSSHHARFTPRRLVVARIDRRGDVDRGGQRSGQCADPQISRIDTRLERVGSAGRQLDRRERSRLGGIIQEGKPVTDRWAVSIDEDRLEGTAEGRRPAGAERAEQETGRRAAQLQGQRSHAALQKSCGGGDLVGGSDRDGAAVGDAVCVDDGGGGGGGAELHIIPENRTAVRSGNPAVGSNLQRDVAGDRPAWRHAGGCKKIPSLASDAARDRATRGADGGQHRDSVGADLGATCIEKNEVQYPFLLAAEFGGGRSHRVNSQGIGDAGRHGERSD